MDTLSCTAEPKLTMMGLKDNRQEPTKGAAQSLLMITIIEDDLTLGLRTLKSSISNLVTEIKTLRHPIDKLALAQIGTETAIEMDSITKKRSGNSWNNGPNNRQQTQYNFKVRPVNSDT